MLNVNKASFSRCKCLAACGGKERCGARGTWRAQPLKHAASAAGISLCADAWRSHIICELVDNMHPLKEYGDTCFGANL